MWIFVDNMFLCAKEFSGKTIGLKLLECLTEYAMRWCCLIGDSMEQKTRQVFHHTKFPTYFYNLDFLHSLSLQQKFNTSFLSLNYSTSKQQMSAGKKE